MFAKNESITFNYSEEIQLREKLLDIDHHSILRPICTPSDVILDDKCQIDDNPKYKFTQQSFWLLCSSLSEGLYNLVTDISGHDREAGQDLNEYSLNEARRIINSIIRLRFDRICGKLLLLNSSTKTVDGIVTSKYKWLHNLDFFDQIKSLFNSIENPPTFYTAELDGRWLSLRYVYFTPVFGRRITDTLTDSFYRGIYFSNNEACKVSIKAVPLLYRKIGQTCSLLPELSGKYLRHDKKEFTTNLSKLLSDVLTRPIDNNPFKLLKFDLELSDKLGDNTQKLDDIVNKLSPKHIPHFLAKDIVSNMLYQSAYNDFPVDQYSAKMSERTLFDLYVAMGRKAKKLNIDTKEKLEIAAHGVLTGKYFK